MRVFILTAVAAAGNHRQQQAVTAAAAAAAAAATTPTSLPTHLAWREVQVEQLVRGVGPREHHEERPVQQPVRDDGRVVGRWASCWSWWLAGESVVWAVESVCCRCRCRCCGCRRRR